MRHAPQVDVEWFHHLIEVFYSEKIKFYCESSNAHAQTLIGAPHSESASNTLTLPSTGGDARLVSTTSTATLTNITKIIDPTSSYPGDGTLDAATNGQRYLLTAEISGSQWGISADVNDIVEYNGSAWTKVFDASAISTKQYVTNTYTGKQYQWENETWTSTYEGTYNPGFWRLNV